MEIFGENFDQEPAEEEPEAQPSAPAASASAPSTEKVDKAKIVDLVSEHFDLRPGAFREELKLHRPIYAKTAAYGHFGREHDDFEWEKTPKADALREAAGL